MKSVVAEASTIAKAIELAWQKAGQPKEFLIKVFQEPQRNIFGLTKTSAKIGIFFDDAAMVQKIKNATQSTIPSTHNNTQKTAINNSASKQISPIKPLNKNTSPKLQAPRPPKPVTKSQPAVTNATSPVQPVAPVSTQLVTNSVSESVTQPIIAENITPSQINSSPNANNPTTSSTTGQPRTTPRKKYYHRRKPRTPRANSDGNGPAVPTAPANKSEN